MLELGKNEKKGDRTCVTVRSGTERGNRNTTSSSSSNNNNNNNNNSNNSNR